jgi:hypothetical protein
MTDRHFVSSLRKAIALMEEHKKEAWVSAYLAKAKPLADALEKALPATEHAEAEWHKDAGAKVEILAHAEERYRHWAGHLRADVHGVELAEFIADYDSAGGFADALEKMTDAFAHRAKKKGELAYGHEAQKDLEAETKKVHALLTSTRSSWQAFRDAAAEKNALKARAWEIFKAVRRHLVADLGDHASVHELRTPPRRAKKSVAQPAAPSTPATHD